MVDYFLFDLDGTVTTEELLPRIARAIGKEKQIEELTKLTIKGEIPFEYSLRHRVEILNVVSVSRIKEIVAEVEINKDILSFLKSNSNRCKIVTGNLDAWIADLVPRLEVPVISSSVEVRDDRITDIINIVDKKKVAQSFSGNICAIGDGANDIGMIETAHTGIAFGGVHNPAEPLFDVATHAIYDGGTLCQFLSQL